MFMVLLKFSSNKDRAGRFMDGHNEWVKRGFAEGVFLLAGSLQPRMGGAILVNDRDLDALQRRVNDDPFVAEGVVTAEILEISPNQTDERLNFLLG